MKALNKKVIILKLSVANYIGEVVKPLGVNLKKIFFVDLNRNLIYLFVAKVNYRIHFFSSPLNSSLGINSAPKLSRWGV